MRERRETLSFLSFLPRRERPLLAGKHSTKATWDAVDFPARHRSAKRNEYQFQFHLNWDIIHILRACSDHFYVNNIAYYSTTVFFSHWRRAKNPKRLCFWETFDAFWYFFTEYHLISYGTMLTWTLILPVWKASTSTQNQSTCGIPQVAQA